jgi:hypothetical protein
VDIRLAQRIEDGIVIDVAGAQRDHDLPV